MIWPWNLCLPLVLGVSSLSLAYAFYRATAWIWRILIALFLPPTTALLMALIFVIVTGDGYSACFFFGYGALWAYLGVPIGALFGWLGRLIF